MAPFPSRYACTHETPLSSPSRYSSSGSFPPPPPEKPNEMKEMVFTAHQEGQDRCAGDLSSWRSSPVATQSSPSPPMQPPPPPSPTPLFPGGHIDTNIEETTTTNSSSVSGSDFGTLPSPSHFPSFPMTAQAGQMSSVASSYPPAGDGIGNDVGGIRGAFSIGRVHTSERAGPQQQQQQQQR